MELNTQLLQNFNLLCEVMRQEKNLSTDLTKIETIINEDIPDLLKENAPTEYYQLYTDFKAEFSRFKDFILYDELIGKNVVALGGGFSSGKSSFLNSVNGENALPSDIDPSTSVPTYIVNAESHKLYGINIFDSKIEIPLKSISKIAHGFGKLDDENIETSDTTLAHVLENMFLRTPKQVYQNIAFLDTPGYSKPDSNEYSVRTDAQIARGQLNSSNFILWFIQADAGTITQEDVNFIKTLRKDIPKLFILNKADKKTDSDLENIVAKIKETLELKDIDYVDVLKYSSNEKSGYDSGTIRDVIGQWNNRVYESNFAKNFKVLFVRCKEFYEEMLGAERRRLNKLNVSITKLSAEDIDFDTLSPLNDLSTETKKIINDVVEVNAQLKKLQNEFFTEIKVVGDHVGIEMPEPNEIDLLDNETDGILSILTEYKKSKKLELAKINVEEIERSFENVDCVFAKNSGGSEYKELLFASIEESFEIDKENAVFSKTAFNDFANIDLGDVKFNQQSRGDFLNILEEGEND